MQWVAALARMVLEVGWCMARGVTGWGLGLRTPVVCGGLRLTKDGTYATQKVITGYASTPRLHIVEV